MSPLEEEFCSSPLPEISRPLYTSLPSLASIFRIAASSCSCFVALEANNVLSLLSVPLGNSSTSLARIPLFDSDHQS